MNPLTQLKKISILPLPAGPMTPTRTSLQNQDGNPKHANNNQPAAVVTPKAFASLPLWGAQAASRNELSFT
jgi:hypothetical protein